MYGNRLVDESLLKAIHKLQKQARLINYKSMQHFFQYKVEGEKAK